MEPDTKVILTMSKGSWVAVETPVAFQGGDAFYYACVWACLVREKGIAPMRATQIAEAAVYQRQFPGLVYDGALGDDLHLIFS
jgi:hypothetical protein